MSVIAYKSIDTPIGLIHICLAAKSLDVYKLRALRVCVSAILQSVKCMTMISLLRQDLKQIMHFLLYCICSCMCAGLAEGVSVQQDFSPQHCGCLGCC